MLVQCNGRPVTALNTPNGYVCACGELLTWIVVNDVLKRPTGAGTSTLYEGSTT